MASTAVMAAVRARLDTHWSRCPVHYPNETAQTPADGSPFLAVQYPLASEEMVSIGAPGSNLYREEGGIRFLLAIPRGSGVQHWGVWIEDLRTLFRGKRFDGVVTFAAAPAVLDDRNDAGPYWSLTCAVPYQFDLLG